MPRPASTVAAEVASRAHGLQLYLSRIERSHTAGHLPLTDVERAYSGAFLEFHAYTERSIQRLFLGLLRGRLVSEDPDVRPLVTIQSDAVAAQIVRGDRSYADWLPFDRYTLKRSKAFFARGSPFSRIDENTRSVLEDSCVLRNAIAHQSSAALRKFRKRFVQNKHLPPRQRRPQGYLRGTHTVGLTRINFLMWRVCAVMRKLSK